MGAFQGSTRSQLQSGQKLHQHVLLGHGKALRCQDTLESRTLAVAILDVAPVEGIILGAEAVVGVTLDVEVQVAVGTAVVDAAAVGTAVVDVEAKVDNVVPMGILRDVHRQRSLL